MSEVQRWNPFPSETDSIDVVAAADYDALRAEVADLRQFHSWAEPQILSHGEDTLEIERLRALLRRASAAVDAQMESAMRSPTEDHWYDLLQQIRCALPAPATPAAPDNPPSHG